MILTLVPATATAGGGKHKKISASEQFSAFDADKSGQLDQAEFSKLFVAKAKTERPAGAATASQDDLTSQVNGAFAQADVDKNQSVSQAELTTFLAG